MRNSKASAFVRLRGGRDRNLKNVDVDIPCGLRRNGDRKA